MEFQPEHHLGPSLSLLDGAPSFLLGEYVLVRIPGRNWVDGQLEVDGDATALISNGSSTQHFAFIRQVYPVLSFTRSGALAGYNKMNDTAKAMLLPLPPLSLRHPTPEAFGAPLNFGNWTTFRDSLPVLNRIDLYRETLRPNMQATNAPLSGRSEDEQGRGNLRQGDGGGQADQVASGVTSVTSSRTIIGELEQFYSNTSHDILVLESVDEDAEGADATMRDELILLAHDDPIWMEELRKYLQEEEKEREQMQEERAVRLAL